MDMISLLVLGLIVLSALIMDELMRELQYYVHWCTLFTNAVVLLYETKAEINTKLEIWKETLKTRGFKIIGLKLNRWNMISVVIGSSRDLLKVGKTKAT